MLRGAVIGLGRMGLTHFSILNTHPAVKFVAICDPSAFLGKNVTKHTDLAVYRDPDQLFRETKPDFVIVATPTATHADVAACAITHGSHVFVEKPFTLSSEQSQYLRNLVQGKRLVHQVGYAMRFHDVFLKVKQLLDLGAIGEVRIFKTEMDGPVVLHEGKSTWRSKRQEGGGCLYDFASHAVDLVNYLIGPPDDVVGTVFSRIHSEAVEDAITSTFLYENGCRGTVLVNWSDPSFRKPACRFEALGSNGKIIADFYTLKAFFREAPRATGFTQGWNERHLSDLAQPVRFYVRGFQFTRQLDFFIDCILQQKSCDICSFQDGLETDLVLDRIRNDGETRGFAHGQNDLRRQPVLRH